MAGHRVRLMWPIPGRAKWRELPPFRTFVPFKLMQYRILLCFDQHPYLRYASTPLSGEEEALGWLGGSTLGEDRRLKMALVDP
jgi:hypothetical protein